MPNPYFQFKQFTIYQDRCAMKVGTDAVLLGAWTSVAGAAKILDIGTGTGIIALMLAQRSDAVIAAVEIDQTAAFQAMENVEISPWQSRVHVICESFQNFMQSGNQYNLIVSNPPYFTKSLPAPDSKRTLARHNQELTPDDLIKGIHKLLDPTGKFCIILPTTEYDNFRNIAETYQFFENRKTLIYPSPGKPVKRFLSEYSYEKGLWEETSIIVEKYGRHQYSEEFIELTRDYYLKL